MKVKVLGFPRTIYNLKDSHEPEDIKNKFLDPWSSLQPKFLRQKICNEIVGLFKINGRVEEKNTQRLDHRGGRCRYGKRDMTIIQL